MTAPLVLLHGWGMRPGVWQDFVAALAGAPPCLAPALPGHGDTPAPDSADLAAWSEALLPALPPRAVLVGWSLGAMLALDLAARHPERVAALALIGASPRFVAGPDWPHGLDAATVAAFLQGFASDAPATLRRFLALQVLGEPQRRTFTATLAAQLQDPTEPDRHAQLARGLELLARADLRAACSKVAQPVLLLHGEADALMPLGAARWLAEALPDACLHSFPGCGHAPFLSQPAACATALAEFLDAR